MTRVAFGRLCSQLRELGQSFVSGEQRSRQQEQLSVRYKALKCDVATHDSSSQPLNTKSWDRVELYNEVWIQPIVKLARKYGISDVALGKACRKLRIPHPGRGDSAKSWQGSKTRAAAGIQGRACREAIEEQSRMSITGSKKKAKEEQRP